MNLEEEVNHYLAGLRQSNLIPNDAAIAPKISENKGQSKAASSSRNDLRERPLIINRKLLPAGLTQRVVSRDDCIYFGQKAVVLSQVFGALEMGARSPASRTRVAASCIEKPVHDASNSHRYSNMEPQDRAFMAGTQHATTLAPDHSEAQGTKGEILSESSNAVDIAADNELDIIRHYASSESSEASLSGQIMPAFGKDSVIANEEDYQVLPPSSKVEEEDWDDCGVAGP